VFGTVNFSANAYAYSSCDKEADSCLVVYTEGEDAKDLASITQSILDSGAYSPSMISIEFVDMDGMPTSMSYCFDSKDRLIRNRGKSVESRAELLGRINFNQDHCYIVVY
jgi:hypothetical protein